MPKVALVVDDSMLIRYTVCRFLEERGFAVESATNGVEALEVLSRVRPIVDRYRHADAEDVGQRVDHRAEEQARDRGSSNHYCRGQGRAASTQTETRANFAIYKDIDIEAQLAKALDALQSKD